MPKKLQASFTGGELDPKLHARVDLAKYGTGAALLSNFLVHPYGGASNRPGLEFVAECGNGAGRVRLVDFQLTATDTCVLEFGNGYMRVHRLGAPILSGGVPYQIATPYDSDTIFGLRFEQSNDVLKITTQAYKPQNLSRYSNTDWRFSDIVTAQTVNPPNDVEGKKNTRPLATDGSEGAAYDLPSVYVVTSIAADTGRESSVSSSVTILNDLSHRGFNNEIRFTKTPGASQWNIYKQDRTIFGLIATLYADQPPDPLDGKIAYQDANVSADTSNGVPKLSNPFAGAGDYPRASTYYQQRVVYGGPANKANRIDLSQSGDFNNFNTSFPTRDSDAIQFALSARQRQDVLFFVPVEDLIVFTTSSEWRVRGNDSGTITPNAIDAKQQSSYGCAENIQPLIVQDDIVFVQAKGQTVRSIAYDFGQNKYAGVNLSLLAGHLFRNRTVVAMAYAQAPYSTMIFVMSDGVALSFTYLKAEEVWAWSPHYTDGSFESVAVVAEGDEDVPYFVVRRTVGGVQKRYVERRTRREISNVADAFFVDSGLSYVGGATNYVTGLGHLEGRQVSGTVDGVPVRNLPVVAGRVDLPMAGAKITLGLPYVAELETLDIDVGQVALNGELRNVSKIVIHVERTTGLLHGQPGATLYEKPSLADEGEVTPGGLFTGSYEARIDGDWNNNGRVFFRASLLPATILAVVPQFEAGGDSE